MFRQLFFVIRGAAALLALLASMTGAAAEVTLPTNATPLQQLVFNAVHSMCANESNKDEVYPTVQETGLFTQCGDIVGDHGNQSVLDVLQQVSGNEISTQGALALRVGAGQFANISGRLDALRLGGNVSLSQNLAAFQDSVPPGPGTQVASVPQTFSFTNDSAAQGDGFDVYQLLPRRRWRSAHSCLGLLWWRRDGGQWQCCGSYSESVGAVRAGQL
jgi:hypothetical protein